MWARWRWLRRALSCAACAWRTPGICSEIGRATRGSRAMSPGRRIAARRIPGPFWRASFPAMTGPIATIGESSLRATSLAPSASSASRRRTATARWAIAWAGAGGGQGIAAEALGALCDFLFGQVGFHRIAAVHDPANPASGRVMQKAGMTCEGTLRQQRFIKGRFVDAVVYSILRDEWEERA